MANLSDNIRYPIILDIAQEKYQSIDVMQGNKDSISLDIYINENGNPVTLPAISDKIKYCLESSRPDSENSPIEKEAKSVNGNVVTFECIDEYITSYPGRIYCIVSIYNSSSDKVHKLPYGFYINIIDSPFNEKGVVHSDEFSVLSKLITDSMDLKIQVEEVLDEAEELLPQMKEAVAAEVIRNESEVVRISNENARIEAETLREINTSTAISNCNDAKDLAIEKADLANTVAIACNDATSSCITATENSTTATTNAINATNQCNTATESCINATSDCNTATTNAINATNQCISSTTACDVSTESCINATSDCNTATTNAIRAAEACDAIIENKVAISNTIIDDTHAFSNKYSQDTFATKTDMDECFQSVSNGKTTIASAITDMGVTTSSDATFAQMASNILSIETGVDTSDGTAIASQIMLNKVAYSKGERIVGTLSNGELGFAIFGEYSNAFDLVEITSASSNEYFSFFTYKLQSYNSTSSDYYYLPKLNKVPVPNCIPSNIKAGVKVGGKNGYITGTYTSDATATASDIIDGKTAYVNGTMVTGTATLGKKYARGELLNYTGTSQNFITYSSSNGSTHLSFNCFSVSCGFVPSTLRYIVYSSSGTIQTSGSIVSKTILIVGDNNYNASFYNNTCYGMFYSIIIDKQMQIPYGTNSDVRIEWEAWE